MFKRSLILAALVTVPCLGTYNPKDIFFEFLVTQGAGYLPEEVGYLPEWPKVSSSMTAVMRNVPLYFVSANGTRDYVKNVSFTVAKYVDGTWDLRYKVISSYKSEDMVLKDIKKEVIEDAIKGTFTFPTSSGKPRGNRIRGGRINFTVKSLYELNESESNKDDFLMSMTFINHFLPIEKLHFDENDLLVPDIQKTSIKGSWFSFKAWRDWLFNK